jgi:hypothetical protein
MPKVSIDTLISLWDIQDSLLQSYRSMFITAQSIIFAIGAALTIQAPKATLVLACMGVLTVFLWHVVCRNRALDVTFSQWLVLNAEQGLDIHYPVTFLKSFQACEVVTIENKSVWREIEKKRTNTSGVELDLDPLFKKMLESKTRKKLENYLPLLFLILWIAVILLAFKVI